MKQLWGSFGGNFGISQSVGYDLNWPSSFKKSTEFLEQLLTSLTGAFIDALHVKRGTILSSYVQLWLAFTISGFMHAASMLMLPAPINITWSERTVGMLQFFLWQAAAITFEDFVQWALRGQYDQSKNSRTCRSCIGYLWVTCFMWYSLPFAGDVMLRIRLTEKSFLPFTLVGPWIQKHVPIPWMVEWSGSCGLDYYQLDKKMERKFEA